MNSTPHRSTVTRAGAEPGECVCLGLRRATRAVTKMYDDALRPCELKATQFSLLAALQGRDGVAFSALTSALTMDQTTLTRNLRPLQRRKLVSVRPGEDRRTRIIRLTTEGEKLYAEALPLWSAAQRRCMRRLGGAEWSRIRNELDRLIGRLPT